MHGNVGRIKIVTDQDARQPNGFGLVEMRDPGDGEKAISAIDGTEFEGRRISVSAARTRRMGFGRRRTEVAQGGTLVS